MHSRAQRTFRFLICLVAVAPMVSLTFALVGNVLNLLEPLLGSGEAQRTGSDLSRHLRA
jgi:hypothetical protein